MKKKINKPTGKVRCYACYASLPLWDDSDPDEVIIRHRITNDCVIGYPKFSNESKADLKRFKPVAKKKDNNWKKKGKSKVAHYKKTGDNK